ncbi:MAG: hypothetical protein B7Y02_15000 [Rhodobacterales bacterium 17-64-5]|nr:MAG: hypothetical protein B7Z31_04875 [Rhodobacterales bacterium 12-65-15]OZA06255.1 MAG: hypothetical protein B7Y02_15000 [Rhodobacterales bacterium 17-64-5]
MRTIDTLTLALLIAGGLNWLGLGLFRLDLVTLLAGGEAAARAVQVLVGLAAIWQANRLPARLDPTPRVVRITPHRGGS